MKQLATRTILLAGLGIFAVAWTLLMGIGVSGVSPTDDAGGRSDASQFGAGAHIMYVDESHFPDVTVYLAVNDVAGQAILGLQQAEFTLREDGEPVAITGFVGAGGNATSTVLVIDQSGSMGDEGKMDGAIRAAQSYIDQLKPGSDQLGAIVFSNWSVPLASVGVVTEDGRMLLRGLLGALIPLAGTEFYAATGEAIKMLDGISGRRVVLTLTDGMDNNGQARLSETIRAAVDANVPIYVVGLGSDVDRNGLQRLAQETGGQVYFSPNAAELEQLYQSIASNLRNEYALTYRSLTPNLDGTRRDLSVEIAAASGAISASGVYVVPGILASTLNLAAFIPTFLILLAGLIGLLFVPRLSRQRAGAKETVLEPDFASSSTEKFVRQSKLPEPSVPPPPPEPAKQPSTPAVRCRLTMPLADGETTLGSSPTNSWVLTGAEVAAQQARISLNGGRYVIADATGLSATQVSYSGSPDQFRPIQQNALRDGSRIRIGDVTFVFRQQEAGRAVLERELPLPVTGLVIGNTPEATIKLRSPQTLDIRIRHDGQHWLVERLAGDCQVSYNGDPTQLRPVTQRNAFRPGSLLQVANVTLRIEEAGNQ